MARLGPAQRRRILELALEGRPVPEIARLTGVSARTVYRILADPVAFGLIPTIPRKLAQALRLAQDAAPDIVRQLISLAADPQVDPQARAAAAAALVPLILEALRTAGTAAHPDEPPF